MIHPEEIELFKSLKDLKVVFDVGAREDVTLIRNSPKSEFHLFEPYYAFYLILLDRLIQKKEITINNVGLGDKEEDLPYWIESQSFIVNPFAKDDVSVCRAKITTLDKYCKEKNIKTIDFLKIDTEGFDYKVLLGGKKILNNTRYIQFEYWDGVRKFVDLLQDKYTMHLILEEEIRKCFKDLPKEGFLLPLTDKLIDIIDNKLIPNGVGGNIFCERK